MRPGVAQNNVVFSPGGWLKARVRISEENIMSEPVPMDTGDGAVPDIDWESYLDRYFVQHQQFPL